MAGVRLASSAVGLFLNLQQAPALAVNTNLVAGFVIADADKDYSVRLDAAAKKATDSSDI